MASFEDYLWATGLSPATVREYLRQTRKAEAWFDQRGSSLSKASGALVADYGSTLHNSHSTKGQTAAAFAHYWAYVGRADTPGKALRVPPQPPMVCRALEPEQAAALQRTAMWWWPEGAAVLFGLYLALRREEIARVEWDRFDQHLEWYRVTGKRDKTATLPVHPALAANLDRHRRAAGWVFGGRFGEHVRPATVWRWTQNVAAAAGVGYVTTHQLRHTSLATANDKLGDLRAVQTFARHDRPQTTAGYTRTTRKRLQEVVAALEYTG